ncbi:MAG: hypothetical protein ACRC78_26240, partial [Planktothrix sp.]
MMESEILPPTRSDFLRFLGVISAVGLLVGLLLFANGLSVITITLITLALMIMALCWRYPRR